jgi:hypothetical protein
LGAIVICIDSATFATRPLIAQYRPNSGHPGSAASCQNLP